MADQLFADRYRLESRLGVGGMSTVQLAFDTRLERYVAVKLLAEHLAEDAQLRRALPPRGAGRRAARAPEHRPGLRLRPRRRDRPQLHRHGARRRRSRARRSSRSTACSTRATRSTSSSRPAAGSTTRTATASCTATSSPATCCAATRAWSSSPTSASPRRPRTPRSRRPAPCSAPRRTCHRSRRAGEKAGPPADLYALGVVSYQLLTGRLPYEAASLTELARMQEAGPPLSPSDVDPDIPRSLGEAVMKALHPLPEGRYEGALEMGDALTDGLRGIAPEPTTPRWRSTRRRRRGCSARPPPPARRPAPRTAPRQRTRGLQPIDEPPRRREPARRASVAPPPEPRRAARQAPQPAPRRDAARRAARGDRRRRRSPTRRSRTTPTARCSCARTSAAACRTRSTRSRA